MSYNLSEELYNYLELALPNVLPLVVKGFDHITVFEAMDSDVAYLDIIYDEEIDPIDKSERVLDRLRGTLCEIVTLHGITLTESEIPQLRDLNKLIDGIRSIQLLEDNSLISRVIEGDLSSREKFNEIMIHHCDFEIVEILDLVSAVSDMFIEALRDMVSSEVTDEVEVEIIDPKLTEDFFKLTENENSIGRTLYNRGYTNFNTFEETIKVLPYQISDRLKESLDESTARAALDLLSLMMITRDAREKPGEFFKEHSDILFNGSVEIDSIYTAFIAMYSHFTNYRNALNGKNK